MECTLKLKRLQKQLRTKGWDIERFKEETVKEHSECTNENRINQNRNKVVSEWRMGDGEQIKISAGQDTLHLKEKVGWKPWMSEEIIQLMDEHTKFKTARDENAQQIRYRECKIVKNRTKKC